MMEDNIKVTIIIPCYNHGKSIDKAVNSVLNQTFHNFEIIIINDGSTDAETNEILGGYDKPKTKVLHIANQGPSVARNTGIQEAKGEYILPLDADDTIENTYLEKAIKILDANEDVGVVCCDLRIIRDYKFFKRTIINHIKYKFPECLIFRNNTSFPVTSLFRKADWEKVGGFNSNMREGIEDYDFWLSIIGLGKKVYPIREILFNYNQALKSRDASMSIENQKKMYVTVFRNHRALFLDNIEVILTHSVDLALNNNKLKSINKRLIFLIILTYCLIVLSIILIGINK